MNEIHPLPEMSHSAEQARSSFWTYFIGNWRVTLLIIVFLVISGIISLFTLPLESDPEVKIPIAVVTTVYPGAAPTDIEKLVTDKLEKKLKNLAGLKEMTSSSSEGVSSITVEFEADQDLTESIRNLRDEVNNAKTELPEDAKDPIVTEIRMDNQPILTVSLLADLPPVEMKKYGEKLQDILEGSSGVSEVLI
nr:efflux RND transporter permease subunit [Candidatus Gracilibacteria bacterium]